MGLIKGRFLYYYHSAVILLMIGATCYVAYNFWLVSPLGNSEKLEWLGKASKIMDGNVSEKNLETLERDVNQGNVKFANKQIIDLEKDIRYISRYTKKSESFQNLERSIDQMKKSILDIVSGSEIASVIGVVKTRIQKFNEYVETNNWKSLNRMAQRLEAQLDLTKDYSHSNLLRVKDNLNKSINKMKQVTSVSVLSPENKTAINLKLDTMEVEMSLLEQYLLNLSRFTSSYTDLKASYEKWYKETAPDVSMIQVDDTNKYHHIFFVMVGAGIFLTLSFIISLPLYLSGVRNGEIVLENKILEFIKNNILKTEKIDLDWGSVKFQQGISKLYDYIHKRMSFGSIFQESIPFPAVLFDSNLNVMWANKLFGKEFEVSDDQISNSMLSWEQIRRFTNLGESDPLLEAAGRDIAGIYQVQFKAMKENSKPYPYEMYVSPVTYAGQSRIMIILYPLSSLEETIADQAKSLIGPISRSLDLLSTDKFVDGAINEIKKDFDIAGIPNIYDKFLVLNEHFFGQRNGLYKQIEALENKFYDSIKLLNDVGDLVSERRLLSSTIISHFQNAKKSIVDLCEIRNDLELIFKGSIDSSKRIVVNNEKLVKDSDKIISIVDETMLSVQKVGDVRNDLKNLKISFDDFRSRLYQTIDQAMIYSKSKDGNIDGMSSALNKIKLEGRTLEKELGHYSKTITALDVILSKMQLIIEGLPELNKNEIRALFEQDKSLIDSFAFRASKLVVDGKSAEDNSVVMLKQFYELFKMDEVRLNDVEALLQLSPAEESCIKEMV